MMIIVSVMKFLHLWASGLSGPVAILSSPEDGKAALQAKAKAKSRLKAKTGEDRSVPKNVRQIIADSAEIGIDTWMKYR